MQKTEGMRVLSLLLLWAALPLAKSFSFTPGYAAYSAGYKPQNLAFTPGALGLKPQKHASVPLTPASLPRSTRSSMLSMSSTGSDILVVGGGPSGLAAGLELDKLINEEKSGFPKSTITIVETQPAITSLDTEKAFSYLVAGGGLNFVDRHGLSEVEKQGVRSTDIFFTIVNGADGAIKKNPLPFVDPLARPGWWHPREKFIKILVDAFNAKIEERNKEDGPAKLEFLQGWELSKMDRVSSGGGYSFDVVLRSKSNSGEQRTMRPWLVVGADGLKSTVRERLAEWAREDGATQAEKERYDLKKVYSASAGLRYKVLAVKPNFPVGKNESSGELVVADPTTAISFQSTLQGKDPYRELRLGCLPRKEGNEVRTLNMITMPEHVIWEDEKLGTREGMRGYLKELFPAMLWDEITDDDKLESFAKSRGGQFPRPQTTNSGAAWVAASPDSPTGEVGVVLAGDSLHAFPPDLGQGVNSGLKDVVALGDHLRAAQLGGGEGKAGKLSVGLKGYEAEATAEAKALVRLMQIGGPYQYSQPGLKASLAKTFWIVNFLTRMALSKLPVLGGKLLHPPIFQLIQRGNTLSYRQILALAHQTTATIWAIILSVTAIVLRLTGLLPLPF